jgi:hypothetical protein
MGDRMSRSIIQLEQIGAWFSKLSSRERILVLLTGVSLLFTASFLLYQTLEESIAETRRKSIVRTRDLKELGRLANRYNDLKVRLERLQTTFSAAQLSFEEVTKKIDVIVQQSIGSNTYELKRGRTPEQIGFEYEKQQFTLKVESLGLPQLVQLLYKLEQGDNPLFLGKVDISKSTRDDSFAATLEIFSVRKNS